MFSSGHAVRFAQVVVIKWHLKFKVANIADTISTAGITNTTNTSCTVSTTRTGIITTSSTSNNIANYVSSTSMNTAMGRGWCCGAWLVLWSIGGSL